MTKNTSLLLAVLLGYFALANYTSWHIPLSAGPDESAHFLFARFLYQNHTLPLTLADRNLAGYKSDQPPLNALLVATTLGWYEQGTQAPFVKLNEDPRHQLIVDYFKTANLKQWLAVNTLDPPRGELFIWRWGRWLSLVWGTLTLTVIYRIALTFLQGWPRRHAWATAVVMAIAYVPAFVYISSVFSYESLLGLWLSLYLWAALTLLQQPRFSLKLSFGAGWLIGLAIMTKLSALVAPLSFMILWFFKARTQPKALLSGLLGMAMAAAGWFGLILWYLNQVQELGWVKGLIAPIINADGSDEAAARILDNSLTLSWSLDLWQKGLSYLVQTMWVRHTEDFALGMGGVTLLGLVGVIIFVWQHPSWRVKLAFVMFHAGLFTLFPLIRLIVTQKVNVAMQGQHLLMPALGVFALALALGIGAWQPRWGYWGARSVGLGLLGYNLFLLSQLSYTPVPIRTVEPYLPITAIPLNHELPYVKLIGYELYTQPEVLNLKLYFMTDELMGTDYLIQTGLTDAQGQLQSAWLGHGLGGQAPTRAWEPGDVTVQETWLPLTGVVNGLYTVTLMIEGLMETPLPLTSLNVTGTSCPDDTPPTLWASGQAASTLQTFREQTTLQVTSPYPVQLVAPDQTAYFPQLQAGYTSLFVINPLWIPGQYLLQTAASQIPVILKTTPRLTAAPVTSQPQAANFANFISLLSYQIPATSLSQNYIPLQLYWQATSLIPANFIMFTRVYDEKGQLWGGYDRLPQETYSPMLWAKGEIVADNFDIHLKPNTPNGKYYVNIGFYLPVGRSTVSLPLIENSQATSKTTITLGPFTIQ